MAWTTLPAEHRCIILEHAAKEYVFDAAQPYLRVGYATVSREWQSIFEPKNFRRLIIDQQGVFKLDKVMGKEENKYRREYLEHLFLRIKVDEYDCTVCRSKEDDETVKRNNDIFSRAMWNLTSILSKWTGLAKGVTGRNQRPEGLRLELDICSPSDCKHVFHDIHFEIRNSPRTEIDGLNDLDHGWFDGLRVVPVGLESKERITGKLEFDPKGRHLIGPPEKNTANKVLDEEDRPKRRVIWLP